MCGVFGFVLQNETLNNYNRLKHSVKLLFRLSEVRGKDAAGMAVLSHNEIQILRRVMKSSVMLKEAVFEKTLKSVYHKQNQFADKTSPLMIIGQCRLVTNGSMAVYENNQPVCAGHFVGVHNGIVVNASKLLDNNQQNKKINDSITKESLLAESDTRLFFSRINNLYRETADVITSLSKAFCEIDGSASVALLNDSENKLVIASNTGSLYYLKDLKSGNAVFASEKRILENFLRKNHLFDSSVCSDIIQIEAGTGLEFENTKTTRFNFKERYISKDDKPFHKVKLFTISNVKSSVSTLRRCTKCILPSTYPFISFDEKGVCNFCNKYEKQKFHGSESLEKILDRCRSKNGQPDCLVGISGGRDSSYGIHILKTKYGMNPVAYTYDWGLTTDISRINQAKVCGKLGIEHIIRAPDIKKKRRHIRKNIYAWLNNPKLGMVPLFMAGDKDFYHFGRQLRREVNVDLTIFCSGCLLEQREFFVGFCGVNENVTKTARLYNYSKAAKMKLALWYISQYVKNPRYINESLFDSIRSYFTSFIHKDDFLYLYEYLPWEEKKIEMVLKEEYGWEDYKAYGSNQWRMGDGQTAFTNYIFHEIAGFTEYDNFRSNQIREGLIIRDEALKLVENDNKPKYEVLQYFSYLIGFNLEEVLSKINTIPKLY